jgi:glycosyltransferase involved in cell wall biosynthesis
MSVASAVLYVANSAKIGGGNMVLMQLMRGLDRQRFVPHLVVPGVGPMAQWAEQEGLPVTVIPAGDWEGGRRLLSRARRFLGLAARLRAKVVHASAPLCYRAAGLAATLVGAARVCHLEFPPEPGELAHSFVAGPDAFITCYAQQATEIQAEMARLRPSCRLDPIPNSVDIERFHPLAPGEPAVALPVPPGRPVVLITGHISPVKGYDAFVRAAARIVVRVPDAEFVALGGDTLGINYRPYLETLASELGIADRLHFLGWRQDVPDLLRAADVVVMPSTAEGLPLAVLEAMASGKAVVATPVGGVAEAIVDGESGLLVHPGDDAGIAAAVVSLLTDDERRAAIGRAARARAESEFSVERFVSRVQDVYAALLEGQACRRPAPTAA